MYKYVITNHSKIDFFDAIFIYNTDDYSIYKYMLSIYNAKLSTKILRVKIKYFE